MEKVLENGTEVVLFKDSELEFIKGIVIKCEKKEFLTLAGDSLLLNYYTIKTEEGNLIKTLYGNNPNGYYVKTTKDFLNYVKNAIDNNTKTINELNNYNAKLYNIAYSLSPKEEEKGKTK